MERELINIVEYLALGEIEHQLSQDYAHQELFSDPIEHQLILQGVLNRMPAVYLWFDHDQCPGWEHLQPEDQRHLQQLTRQEIQRRLQQATPHHCPYAEAMPEIFYG